LAAAQARYAAPAGIDLGSQEIAAVHARPIWHRENPASAACGLSRAAMDEAILADPGRLAANAFRLTISENTTSLRPDLEAARLRDTAGRGDTGWCDRSGSP